MNKVKNQVCIESVDRRCLNLYLRFVLKIFLKQNVKYSIFFLPLLIKRITFLKSPHVFKKAKEHFELRKQRVILTFYSKSVIPTNFFFNKPSLLKTKIMMFTEKIA